MHLSSVSPTLSVDWPLFAALGSFLATFPDGRFVPRWSWLLVVLWLVQAIFQPLRLGIQAIIDRRFYRHKYNAAKTIAAFSASLRNEVDLNTLREHLITVVQDTMQPSQVSLWLRKSDNEKKSNTLL